MNMRSYFRDTLKDIRTLEGQYVDKVKSGSKDPTDYHNMSYFSGVHNGFNFVWSILDGQTTDYDGIKKQLLQIEGKAN